MWIYNGEMLINLENGVNLHIRQQALKYSEYEAAVALFVPVEAEGDNSNWIFQGTATECANYIRLLSKDLNAQKMAAYGSKIEPEPKPEREPRHLRKAHSQGSPVDYSDQCSSDIPF